MLNGMDQCMCKRINIGRIGTQAGLGCIWFYRVCLSPLKPSCCRFQPTCSHYAANALREYGILKGGLMACWRLLRCHPFYHGPLYDPVPAPRDKDGGGCNQK